VPIARPPPRLLLSVTALAERPRAEGTLRCRTDVSPRVQSLQVRLHACWGQSKKGSTDTARFAGARRQPAAGIVTEDHLMSTKLAEKNTQIEVFSS